MSRIHGLVASLEAVDFQYGSDLHKQLTQHIVNLRDKGRFDDAAIRAEGMHTTIANITGLAVQFKVFRVIGASPVMAVCEIELPDYKVGHTFIHPWAQKLLNGGDAVKALRSAGDVLRGEVDLRKGMVTGAFANALSTIHFSDDWLESGLTPEVQAAKIMHECGHAFTFFESFAETTRTNYALAALSMGYASEPSREIRVTMVEALEDVLKIKVPDRKELANEGDAVARQTVVVTSVLDRIRSETRASVYDTRATEFLADQWATRYGAGRYLAEAVAAMDKLQGGHATASRKSRALMETMAAVAFIGAGVAATFNPFTTGLLICAVLFGDSLLAGYDAPAERVAAIEREMIAGLKSAELTREQRRNLLEDLAVVQKQIKELQPEDLLVFRFVKRFSLQAARTRKTIELQRAMEKLGNSRAYATGQRLLDMSKDFK